jgi:hypothetical protein
VIKTFCDICGQECVSRVGDRLKRKLRGFQIEVMVGKVRGAWNSGHVCTSCVIDIVTHGEDVTHG